MRDLWLVGALLAAIAILNDASAQEGRVKVTVVDESNRGISSLIYVKNSVSRIRLGQTDEQGRLEKPYQCNTGNTVYAEPQDRGSYFDSKEEDCRPELTLRVLQRQTPRGVANDFTIKTFTALMANGAPVKYIFVSRAITDTSISTTGWTLSKVPVPKQQRCEVQISPSVYTDVYVERQNNQLEKIDATLDAPTLKGSNLNVITTIYNNPCSDNHVDVEKLESRAASDAISYVGKVYASPSARSGEPGLRELLDKYGVSSTAIVPSDQHKLQDLPKHNLLPVVPDTSPGKLDPNNRLPNAPRLP